jgi:caffeoyl-CoA O-methyltransferase
MNSRQHFKRRDFLAASGTVAIAAIAGELSSSMTFAAERRSYQPIENVLKEVEAEGEKFLTVAPKEGRFLKMLVGAAQAKRVLEIGTAEGYGTLWLGLGIAETGGHITTIEIVAERVQKARARINKAELAKGVTFHEGNAHGIVPKLDGPFDLIFMDADKDGQVDYFNKLYPAKLAPGGIIAAHNAIKRADKMQPYLDMIAKHDDFDAVIASVTMDDGFSVAYRRRT